MQRSLPGFLTAIVSAALLVPACADSTESSSGIEDDVDAIDDAKGDRSIDDAFALLLFVNHREVGVEMLMTKAGLSERVAKAIIKQRDGRDKKPDTADDQLFQEIETLDKIPYVGPAALKALVEAGRAWRNSAPSLSISLIGEDSGEPIKLSDLNAKLAAKGLPPFEATITVGANDSAKFQKILDQVEAANEALDKSIELQRSWDPNDYTGLCFRGDRAKALVTIESLSATDTLFSAYMGIQAERFGDVKRVVSRAYSTEQEMISSYEEAGEDGALEAIEVWKNYKTTGPDYLILTDGGQQGDGTELFAVRIPPCAT